MGIAALYKTVAADTAKTADDTKAAAAAEAAVAADQATETADQTAFAVALAAPPFNGRVAFLDPADPTSVILVTSSVDAPGYTVEPVLIGD